MADAPYRAGKGRGRGGLDTSANDRLKQRNKETESKTAPRLPGEDDSVQTNLLLGNGAVKKMRCGKCTRPLDNEAIKSQQLQCTRCTGGRQAGSSPGDAKSGKSGKAGKGGKAGGTKSSSAQDTWWDDAAEVGKKSARSRGHGWDDDAWGDTAWGQSWDEGWGDAWTDDSWWHDSQWGESEGKGKRKGKGKGKGEGKGKEKGKGKSKGKAVAEQAASEETRYDPSDGCIYTFEDIMLFYKGEFTRKEVDAYWNSNCEPIHPGGTGKQKGAGKGSQREVAGRGAAAEKVLPYSKMDAATPLRAKVKEAAAWPDEDSTWKASKPRFYMANFKSTEDIALSMTERGWISKGGDPRHRGSILVPGGRKVNPLSHGSSADFTVLPGGLLARAEELGELLEGLVLMGGDGDFSAFAFALLPGEEDIQVAIMDALGVGKAARFEVTLDETSWDVDFTDQQMDANLGDELSKATELLKTFGKTYELNFTESLTCAPVVYFAQSTCSPDRPIIGVIHAREWK